MRISDWSSDVCSSDLSIKLELAQYREMAAFAQFGSDLDASTQRLLNRGARLTELLKQAQFSPMPFEEQTVSIFAGTSGYIDDVPVDAVTRYEAAMLADMRANHAGVLKDIRDKRSEEHTSELQSLMRISYAVSCLKNKPRITKSHK